MSTTIPPPRSIFERELMEGLNAAMLKAAEPVVQQALKDIEREMRQRLAERLIALIERNFEVVHARDELVIRVRQEVRR